MNGKEKRKMKTSENAGVWRLKRMNYQQAKFCSRALLGGELQHNNSIAMGWFRVDWLDCCQNKTKAKKMDFSDIILLRKKKTKGNSFL